MQYNFVIAHIPGSTNTGAVFLSPVELDATKKLEFTIRDDIQVTPIEVNIQSNGVAEEETLYLEGEDALTQEQLWKQKQHSGDKAKFAHEKLALGEIDQMQKYHHPTASRYQHKFGHFKDNAKIRIEKNNDPVLRNLRKIVEKQISDENEFISDTRYKYYQQNLPRTEVRNDVLVRKYYDDTGMISHYQLLLPHQLPNEFLHSLHGQSAKSPGIAKKIQEARRKRY